MAKPQLKSIKNAEEGDKVPLDQSVMVDLGIEPGPKDEPEKKPPPKEQDDTVDVGDLQKQIETMKAAQKDRDEREAQIIQDRDNAYQEAKKQTLLANQSKAAKYQSDIVSVTSSLAAAQAEQEAASQDLQAAFNAADAAGVSKANQRMARAAASILNCESAQANLEQRIANEARQIENQNNNQQQSQPTKHDIIARIQNAPEMSQQEKDYVTKLHPELIFDAARGEELRVAHNRAIRAGNVRGTQGYFGYLDEFLGFKEGNDDNDTTNGYVAPVIRNDPTGSPGANNNTRITLTPQQREIARSMGLTDVEYAQGVKKMNEDKSANPEKYAGRR